MFISWWRGWRRVTYAVRKRRNALAGLVTPADADAYINAVASFVYVCAAPQIQMAPEPCEDGEAGGGWMVGGPSQACGPTG